MRLRKEDIVELWVDRMAFGGQGIARMDGLVIFVKGAVPGDRVLARVIKRKKDYAEADLVEVIDPSPDRVKAPCPYNGFCGGCNYQHIDYSRQLEFKRDHVRDAMERIGSLPGVPIHNVIPSEKIFGYRNKMEFSFSDRRWLLPGEFVKGEPPAGFGLGLHAPGVFYKIIDMEGCLLQEDTGNRILRAVKEYVRSSGAPVYGLKSHEGLWRFLVLRRSVSRDEWLVNIVTSQENKKAVMPLAAMLKREFTNISTVVNNITSKRAAVSFGEKEIILSGPGHIRDRIGDFDFQVSANSFFQTNTSGAWRLYEKVVEYAELSGRETVLDLYCGTGTIPIFLSAVAGSVVGIEIVESAVTDAIRNCRENNIDNCGFILGDIRDKLDDLGQKPDVMVIDPPRAGMHKDIPPKIIDMGVKKIVYVSCNPATMARDINSLRERYEVVEIQPVDMFPHTYHIESVAKLVLKKDL
ncbi:MAG: 23S rRNA (uracil(1939)-C(5))-methyltransferase RlmD [Deltaproteobacteria bacterium]|nr:23S rRNA (uracil(1939)-C(5))-methyltransferase RlmD [Deltaproteobacteria bacterium]